MAASSCWLKEGLGIGASRLARHSGPQTLQSAELELFYGSFAFAHRLSDFSDALFLAEPHPDNAALVSGKSVHEPEKLCTPLDLFQLLRGARFSSGLRCGNFAVLSRPPHLLVRVISNSIGGDPKEPGCEGSAARFKAPQVSEGLMKHLRGQIFGLIAVANAHRNVGVDSIEIRLVKLGEAARILLCRLHQKLLVSFLPASQGSHPTLNMVSTARTEKGYEEIFNGRGMPVAVAGNGIVSRDP